MSALDMPGSPGSESRVPAKFAVPLPDLPSSISKKDSVKSQRAVPSLSTLWDQVLPVDQVRDVALGYFCSRGHADAQVGAM